VNKSKVALVRCDTYHDETVCQAVEKGLELIGGVSSFIKPGERIVMKPNVLYGTSPEKGVCTHPSVFRAVGIALKKACASVCYGDSPSFGRGGMHMGRAGLKRVADDLGIERADFDKGRTVSHRDALLIKSFVVANGVLDSDGLVNLPKLKTHPLVRFTGAVKNQFGCVPGLLKSQYHVKLLDPYDFARMLVDLNTLTRPRFCVMDGIVAMEGNGPRSGKLTNLNVLLFSSDPVALDATACRIINLDPEVVPTATLGEKARLGNYRSDEIELVGESIDSFVDGDFDVIRTPPEHANRSRIRTLVKNRLSERPAINKASCTVCGLCVKMCPVNPKAVNWRRGDQSRPPTYDYDLCIRCYCCQESCPEGAVFTQSPLLGRLLSTSHG
jgi:uncharacterized protein (DUF362 family)/Pyruvate/2-oxoacid:ferredoxin oxidoreductase delta subunit